MADDTAPAATAEDLLYAVGNGNWAAFRASAFTLDDVHAAASEWAAALAGVARPWLCWNVDPDWNLVQQKLVESVGWTPVVGFDPRVGPPPLRPGAILIDFNARFRLPSMWMHFPLEFIFLFCERMAFWHADCLLRPVKMAALAERFAALPDGEAAAVKPRLGWRMRLNPRLRRYWEVVGCTTRAASRSQFEHGCGWWMHFAHHPNGAAEFAARSRYYWDSGVGIWYWRHRGWGRVHLTPKSYIDEGHFTGIGRPGYRRASPKNQTRDLSKELSLNYDLRAACASLGLQHLLAETPAAG